MPAGDTSTLVAQPLRRQHHAITYDPVGRRVILHGGLSRDRGGLDAPPLADIWSWDGQHWTTIAENSGVGLVGHLLFADNRGTIFSVGGEPVSTTNRWDGQRWQVVTSDSLLRRSLASGAYDSRRGRFVLFGGRVNVAKTRAGDTWEFDGQRWTQVATDGPPALIGAFVAYDARRGATVLFGGRGADGFAGATWTWDGARWQQVATTGPGPRFDGGMVFDSKRGEIVLFGGYGENDRRFDDTWIWNGQAWRRAEASGPTPRNEGFMAFDASRGVTVLFGGCCSDPAGGVLGDTWEWDGERWKRVG
jgi:hypothetical protein